MLWKNRSPESFHFIPFSSVKTRHHLQAPVRDPDIRSSWPGHAAALYSLAPSPTGGIERTGVHARTIHSMFGRDDVSAAPWSVPETRFSATRSDHPGRKPSRARAIVTWPLRTQDKKYTCPTRGIQHTIAFGYDANDTLDERGARSWAAEHKMFISGRCREIAG